MGRRFQSSEQAPNRNRLRWLGRVFHVSTEHLPRCTMFFEEGNGWKMVRGGQWMRLVKTVIALTSGLAHADAVRLPGRAS